MNGASDGLSSDFQREGKAMPEASLPFHRAMPSMTHMALVALEKAGILKFVISQVGLCSLFPVAFGLFQAPIVANYLGVSWWKWNILCTIISQIKHYIAHMDMS